MDCVWLNMLAMSVGLQQWPFTRSAKYRNTLILWPWSFSCTLLLLRISCMDCLNTNLAKYRIPQRDWHIQKAGQHWVYSPRASLVTDCYAHQVQDTTDYIQMSSCTSADVLSWTSHEIHSFQQFTIFCIGLTWSTLRCENLYIWTKIVCLCCSNTLEPTTTYSLLSFHSESIQNPPQDFSLPSNLSPLVSAVAAVRTFCSVAVVSRYFT